MAPVEAWAGLTTAVYKTDRYNLAEGIAAKGLAYNPDSLELRVAQADIAVAKQDWQLAIERWEKIMSDFSDKKRLGMVYARLVDAYCKVGNLQAAERVAAEGASIHPTHIAVRSAHARSAAARHNWPLAIARWKALIKDFKGKVPEEAYVGLAKARRCAGLMKIAEDSANDGIKRFPDSPDSYIELAETATAQKNWRRALKLWDAAYEKFNDRGSVENWKKINIRFHQSVIKRIVDIDKYKKERLDYITHKAEPKKYVIYTAASAGYDTLKLPEKIDERFDYVIFTDDETVDGYGIYDIRPFPTPELDPARAIRYPKTHPHILFGGYDAAIWVDTSIMLSGDIMPLLQEFLKSGKPVGNSTHPARKDIYEEFNACIELGKDNPEVLKKQMQFYKKVALDIKDLSENGVLFFNLGNKDLAPVMETWWEQVMLFSKRDQLSFNYALFKNESERYKLCEPPISLRNHPNFILTAHHSKYEVLDELYKLFD